MKRYPPRETPAPCSVTSCRPGAVGGAVVPPGAAGDGDPLQAVETAIATRVTSVQTTGSLLADVVEQATNIGSNSRTHQCCRHGSRAWGNSGSMRPAGRQALTYARSEWIVSRKPPGSMTSNAPS